jgi:hypothetical protein
VEASFNYVHRTMVERDARHVREVLKNPNYRPKLRGCEARECISPSTAREDGHHLCAVHRTVPVSELARTPSRLPKNAADFAPPMREPGSDDEEIVA